MTANPSPSTPDAAAAALAGLHRRNVRAYLWWTRPCPGALEGHRIPLLMPVVAIRNPLPPWKRAIDVAASLAALPLLAVGTLLVTVMMTCACPGPIFYRQERIGFAGRRIRIYRFRTLPVRENRLAPLPPGIARPRSLPGGWLLRASGADELPQVLNILRGEMSLVGPRPLAPHSISSLHPQIVMGRQVLPGITGLAQVASRRPATSGQCARFDSLYARRLSFRSDVRILALTIPSVCRQIGRSWRERKRPPSLEK